MKTAGFKYFVLIDWLANESALLSEKNLKTGISSFYNLHQSSDGVSKNTLHNL